MKLMSRSNLVQFLKDFKGSSFVTLTTATSPVLLEKNRVTKESNPYLQRIKRFAVRQGMIGAKYENAVNNARKLEKNDDVFVADSLWKGKGEHVSACLVRHKDTQRHYLAFYPKNDKGDVKVSESYWAIDGLPVPDELVNPYLPVKNEGSKRQETEFPVPWRVIALDSIIALAIDGENYMITP